MSMVQKYLIDLTKWCNWMQLNAVSPVCICGSWQACSGLNGPLFQLCELASTVTETILTWSQDLETTQGGTGYCGGTFPCNWGWQSGVLISIWIFLSRWALLLQDLGLGGKQILHIWMTKLPALNGLAISGIFGCCHGIPSLLAY